MNAESHLYMSVEQVAARLSVSTDTIYRWKREGRFPRAYKMSPGCVRWKLTDIEDWENSLQSCLIYMMDFWDD